MADTNLPRPVKFLVAALYRKEKAFEIALREINYNWGRQDFTGIPHLFDTTSYYEKEMGEPLFRRIVALEKLIVPERLVEFKLYCNELEKRLSIEGRRKVNLDAGYLDHSKVVLASVKEAGQKIYLSRGIYADLVAKFRHGSYRPFEWSFPDFKDNRYQQELQQIRKIYLDQIRNY